MRKMYIQLYCIFLSFATTISISKKKNDLLTKPP